jgi:hypothetical protein
MVLRAPNLGPQPTLWEWPSGVPSRRIVAGWAVSNHWTPATGLRAAILVVAPDPAPPGRRLAVDWVAACAAGTTGTAASLVTGHSPQPI